MKKENILFRYGNDVAIGDEVLTQENDELTPEKVSDVSTFTIQGDSSPYFVALFSLINKGHNIYKIIKFNIFIQVPMPLLQWMVT